MNVLSADTFARLPDDARRYVRDLECAIVCAVDQGVEHPGLVGVASQLRVSRPSIIDVDGREVEGEQLVLFQEVEPMLSADDLLRRAREFDEWATQLRLEADDVVSEWPVLGLEHAERLLEDAARYELDAETLRVRARLEWV